MDEIGIVNAEMQHLHPVKSVDGLSKEDVAIIIIHVIEAVHHFVGQHPIAVLDEFNSQIE